ncbi:unnamed protein product [Acanthoscelides obtectus]|uniref:Uncharacterized protein n=1 Tax=Acanthoscelides obtectus TaxID=200917 RepID=A0A9P0PJ15_ACAOB|nr:unnamed protein product [Acanthoscelides obtectus]CAK1641514.1 hypothetical protein AOBTE_LOCUS12455 [Acanthoscelides obtectus]
MKILLRMGLHVHLFTTSLVNSKEDPCKHYPPLSLLHKYVSKRVVRRATEEGENNGGGRTTSSFSDLISENVCVVELASEDELWASKH